jgi:hypothetical protein
LMNVVSPHAWDLSVCSITSPTRKVSNNS